MDRFTEILQVPGPAICMRCIQNMSGVESVAHATVVQHYVASLHAFTIFAGPQGLVKAFKLKVTLTVAQHATSYPAASFGTCLLYSHCYEIHHVVDGAKEWRNLAKETEMTRNFDF